MTLQLTGACKSHGVGIRDLEPNLNDWLCNFNSSECRSRDLVLQEKNQMETAGQRVVVYEQGP
eukprot:362943-Hanusia_phi.AAC.1